MFVLRARGRVPAPDPGRNNTALQGMQTLEWPRVVLSMSNGSNPPPALTLRVYPNTGVFGRPPRSCPAGPAVWAGEPTLTTPVRHGLSRAPHDPPLRAVRSAMSPGAGGRCTPLTWPPSATTSGSCAPCASAYSETRRYERPTDGSFHLGIFRYLCLSTFLTRYMNISTGYDNLLISPGRPHSGGVRPSST